MKSLKLPADLRIQSVGTLKTRLARALEGEGVLRVNGAGVDRVDTAGLQLLVVAANEAARRGRSLRLASASAPLAEGLKRLGLEAYIQDSSSQPAGAHGRPKQQDSANA